nr:vegetative cell wall protein gp1-like [Aegilops tauschii subsp. strangulata]
MPTPHTGPRRRRSHLADCLPIARRPRPPPRAPLSFTLRPRRERSPPLPSSPVTACPRPCSLAASPRSSRLPGWPSRPTPWPPLAISMPQRARPHLATAAPTIPLTSPRPLPLPYTRRRPLRPQLPAPACPALAAAADELLLLAAPWGRPQPPPRAPAAAHAWPRLRLAAYASGQRPASPEPRLADCCDRRAPLCSLARTRAVPRCAHRAPPRTRAAPLLPVPDAAPAIAGHRGLGCERPHPFARRPLSPRPFRRRPLARPAVALYPNDTGAHAPDVLKKGIK